MTKPKISGYSNDTNYLYSALETLTNTPINSDNQQDILVATCLLGYFTLEGFANNLGETIAPEKWESEKEFFSSGGDYPGTLGKIQYLSEICKFDTDKGQRPYQTLKKLHLLRNRLCHARTKEYEVSLSVAEKSEWGVGSEISRALKDLSITKVKEDVLGFCKNLTAAAKTNGFSVGSVPERKNLILNVEQVPASRSKRNSGS